VDKGVAVAVAAVVGGLVATQAPLNSQLGRVVGGVNASVVALAVSFVALLTLATLTDGLGGIRRIGDAPLRVAIGGGLAGALYVGSIVFTVRALGAGGLTALTIAGQLGVAMVIDHFGWLGVERSPITAAKVSGVVLLALGAWLVIRE
jgi:bacterial/archaeal transporter family-2 protein